MRTPLLDDRAASRGPLPAVDAEVLTRDRRRQLRRHEQHRTRALIRRGDHLQRHLLGLLLLPLLRIALHDADEVLALDRPEIDAVDADLLRAELDGGLPRQR